MVEGDPQVRGFLPEPDQPSDLPGAEVAGRRLVREAEVVVAVPAP